MTLDLISRAEARIAEIDQQRKELEYEQHELETALKVLHRFLDETASDHVPDAGNMVPAQEPQPSPAAQTDDEQQVSSFPAAIVANAEAAPASVESAAPIQPETATKQRENVPPQHEVRPGSTSPGTEQQCDTLGVTMPGEQRPISPGPVTLTDTIEPKFKPTLAEQLKALFAERGQITMREAREVIDASEPGLWNAAKKAGLKFRHLTKEERAEIARLAMRRSAGEAADGQEAGPAPEPLQTPDPPPTFAPERQEVKHIALTLKDRVRICHEQHPNWTARMIANEIGAPYTSVSTTLGQVRGEDRKGGAHNPAKKDPEFADRKEMLAHYGDIAKRLGKSA